MTADIIEIQCPCCDQLFNLNVDMLLDQLLDGDVEDEGIIIEENVLVDLKPEVEKAAASAGASAEDTTRVEYTEEASELKRRFNLDLNHDVEVKGDKAVAVHTSTGRSGGGLRVETALTGNAGNAKPTKSMCHKLAEPTTASVVRLPKKQLITNNVLESIDSENALHDVYGDMNGHEALLEKAAQIDWENGHNSYGTVL